MALSPAETERRLKARLKAELEKRGYFVKFSQGGTVTVLRGEPGGDQEIVVSDLSIMEAGQHFKVWGHDNPCTTAEQREHPERDPNDPTLDTPTTAAIRADTQEANNMSDSPARQRAQKIIQQYKAGSGAFAAVQHPSTEADPQPQQPTLAASRRDAMMKRQATPTGSQGIVNPYQGQNDK